MGVLLTEIDAVPPPRTPPFDGPHLLLVGVLRNVERSVNTADDGEDIAEEILSCAQLLRRRCRLGQLSNVLRLMRRHGDATLIGHSRARCALIENYCVKRGFCSVMFWVS